MSEDVEIVLKGTHLMGIILVWGELGGYYSSWESSANTSTRPRFLDVMLFALFQEIIFI